MGTKKTIGGDRLGSGKKMTVNLKNYNRSTHDLGYTWRSTMASGTLVPFMTEVALPGDTFDIDLETMILTHPTVGPLFGSYKVQIDVFQAPVRLYQGQLHNNKLGIGMQMANVKLPQLQITASDIDKEQDPDNQQINPSSILSYLNIRGLGRSTIGQKVTREFNAVPYLAYWDIYKNYYANKQEEVGAVIHKGTNVIEKNIGTVTHYLGEIIVNIEFQGTEGVQLKDQSLIMFQMIAEPYTDINDIYLLIDHQRIPANEAFSQVIYNTTLDRIIISNLKPELIDKELKGWDYRDGTDIQETEPRMHFFPLENIDTMREDIIEAVKDTSPFLITDETIEPYNLPLKSQGDLWTKMSSQEGLALKTYQSDLFNNWMSTEWIDGENGINAITSVDTSDGNFSIDQLQLSKKVYDMLNRIAISGGSYDDWLDAVYTHDRVRRVDSPMYMGGLIRELVFEEVISNAEAQSEGSGSQPLGTLAGRGTIGNKKKGGKITIKVDEPSYIMGIISLTPRIDYSQGNKWDVNLKTMDDFHKPALDEIGFQDLITDQMASWDTLVRELNNEPLLNSAGKQPAWINYMTNVNQVRGNFAVDGNEMFMTLNRKYEIDPIEGNIMDLTTYIDPVKFNHIFAQTSRDAQNFWTQIQVSITARRKMSAKVMPNL